MKWTTIRKSSLLAVVSMALAGCCPTPPVAVEPYTGPTESMAAVVSQINQNNSGLNHFHAVLRYSASIVDPQRKKTENVAGDGLMLYARPRSLLLRCKKDVVGPVFELGSNDTTFWFKVLVGESTEWWGHYANLGKPCCKAIPIQPDLVLEVLGVGMFDENLLSEPIPVMRFDNETNGYVFVWSKLAADRWYPWKEVEYDRQTKWARLIKLYDENGRVVLRADLSGHAPVSGAAGPVIARHYEMVFMENGSRMTFDFTDVNFNQPKGAGAFEHHLESDTDHRVQIDEGCK